MWPGVRIVLRQAARNLRARPGQAALILVAMVLATTTLAMALAVNRTGDDAWNQVWRASHGGDAIVWAGYDDTAIPANPPTTWVYDQLASVRSAPGVAAASGPFADLDATGHIGPANVNLSVSVRDVAPSPVDQPVLTAGEWLSTQDGIVLEDALAVILGVHVGDIVAIQGQALPVRGTALTTSAPRYRPGHVGYAWVTGATAERLERNGAVFQGATMPIRLTDPSTADSFAAAHWMAAADPDPAAGFEIDSAAQIRNGGHEDLDTLALALGVVGTALALIMIAITAVLVTARVAAHTRQIGTLKAVGVTPSQVAAIVLVENLVVALAAAVIGVVTGDRLAPFMARTETVLYGAPQAPTLTWTTIGLVLAVAVGVVSLATIRPVRLAARTTTLRALTPPTREPRTAAMRLPGPRTWQIGLRILLRRPTRTAATILGGALAVAMVTIAAALRASQTSTLAHNPYDAANRALLNEIHTILVVAGATLVALALTNAAIVATLAARDNARGYAILRTLGATPGQTARSFLVGQLLSGLLATGLGVPTGIVAFDTLRGGLDAVNLSRSTVVALTGLALLAYGLIAAVPAMWLARRPIAAQLVYE
jgi:putative ABC transport system permease protein